MAQLGHVWAGTLQTPVILWSPPGHRAGTAGYQVREPYLIGSDRKHRPQASLTFCQKESAAMALLKVTGMGRSPKWNLQKGTLLAWDRDQGWQGAAAGPRVALESQAPTPWASPGSPP